MRRKMRLLVSVFISIAIQAIQLGAQNHIYPVRDFHNRSIELPIDNENSEVGTFYQYYQLSSNFDFTRPTLFFFQDVAQQFSMPGEVDKLAKSYHFFDNFNVVYYQIRGRQYSFIELRNQDGSLNWEKAYTLLSYNLIIEDIESIRKDLFKDNPETKILAFGRSGGGFLLQKYLSKYSRYVSRAFIRAAPNSIIMKQFGYPESKYFYNTLNSIDTTLYAKLKIILKKDIVPDYQLYWILRNIPYASENPADEFEKLINELYFGKKYVYQQYIGDQRFDFSKWMKSEEDMSLRDIGMYYAPMEVSAEYMLDSDPEYIDPFYGCLKKLAEPYIKLIQEGKVMIPIFPPLETLSQVDTEVFYLAVGMIMFPTIELGLN